MQSFICTVCNMLDEYGESRGEEYVRCQIGLDDWITSGWLRYSVESVLPIVRLYVSEVISSSRR